MGQKLDLMVALMATLTCATGSLAQYGYTGREPDASGLVHLRHRAYDSSLGRFIQRDPLGIVGGCNDYGYVDGNPVDATDPYGLTPSLGPSGRSLDRLLAMIGPHEAAAAETVILQEPMTVYRVTRLVDQFTTGVHPYPGEADALALSLGRPPAFPSLSVLESLRTAQDFARHLTGTDMQPYGVIKLYLAEGMPVEVVPGRMNPYRLRQILVPEPAPGTSCMGCYFHQRLVRQWFYFDNPGFDPHAQPNANLLKPGNGADLYTQGRNPAWGGWLGENLSAIFGRGGGAGSSGSNMIHDGSLEAMQHLASQRYVHQLHDTNVSLQLPTNPWTLMHPMSR